MLKLKPLSMFLATTFFYTSVIAQEIHQSGATLLKEADQNSSSPGVSPVRRIDRLQFSGESTQEPLNSDFRSINGRNNNLKKPLMGSAGYPLRRMMASQYTDGFSEMAGLQRPSPRVISNKISAQSESVVNAVNANASASASDFLWQWGQFLDHDIDLTGGTDPAEAANISVPLGDSYFDPSASGTVEIPLNRSVYDLSSGIDNPRQQINEITAWIDASNVYGSNSERADALRTLDGTGKMKTSAGNLLPFNEAGFPNAGGNSPVLFIAGDVRANEQLGLTALHTLFVREHNRWATLIAERHPHLEGDDIYLRARRLVGAEMQIITYREYLPLLLGKGALRPYDGYRPKVNASIYNLFATAAYRYGHSALNSQLWRLDAKGNEVDSGHLPLRDAFFAPQRLVTEGGIEPLLRGLASQKAQAIDLLIIDDVRNFLFGQPGEGGFDLAALNIQRGRDHGLPSYNSVRKALGFLPAYDFKDINPDPEIASKLAAVYTSPNQVDVWVGSLAEPIVPGALVGRLIYKVVKLQFEHLRDGDRFWFQQTLTAEEKDSVRNMRLADVIRLNTDIGNEVSDDVFRVRKGDIRCQQRRSNLKEGSRKGNNCK